MLFKTSTKWWFDIILQLNESNTQYTFTSDIYLEQGSLRILFYNDSDILSEIQYNTLGKGKISLSSVYETIGNARIRFLIYGDSNPSAFLDNLEFKKV